MGGDAGPRLVVPAVVRVLRDHPDLQCRLHGDESVLRALLEGCSSGEVARIHLHHASQRVEMDDKPAAVLRHKRDSSLWHALDALANGTAGACVSAGNTGAIMAIGMRLVGTLPGIERPAICSALPTYAGRAWLLDMGANIGCSPGQLLQFARMATTMVVEVESIPRPRLGLLNLGSEAGKGDETVRQAAELFRDDPHLNYTGFVEGDGIYSGDYDIIVCDGFVGNVALKSSEGVARMISTMIRRELTGSLSGRLGALIARPALRRLEKALDPANYNGADLLGLRGTVIKSHGGASEAGFANALRVAAAAMERDVPARISESLARLTAGGAGDNQTIE